jgi:predicted ATPase
VGGVGKTRLALQVAAGLLPRFREGAWLLELAPVRDPAGVPAAVAAAFGIGARAGMTVAESLVEFLRTKQLLLVLDNCEHLLDAVAELVESLERRCGGLVVLATSREGLGLDGERMLVVPSLASPEADAELQAVAAAEAVRLFVERARAAKADFALTATNAGAVAQVCRRLDGVPLAIELAAARVPAMNPNELARRLDRRFEVLAGGRRRAVERHQTLRAAIDWSYELLAEPERRLLGRLAVFAGGCALEAIEAVAAGDPVDASAVFELVAELVAKSLVVAEDDSLATRYRLLETIRQYGEERLDQDGETAGRRAAHAEYYARLGLATGKELEGPQQIDANRRLAAEQENLVAATNHAVDTDNADLGLRLVGCVPWGARLNIAYELLLPVDAVLSLSGAVDHPLYPYGLALLAASAAARGEIAGVEATCGQALAAARRLGTAPDHLVDHTVASARALAAQAVGRWAEAATHQVGVVEVCRAANWPARLSAGLLGAATLYTLAGQPDVAVALASEGLQIARRLGAPIHIAMSLAALAGALMDQDPHRARALLQESVQLGRTLGLEGSTLSTQAALIAAKARDWTLALELAEPAMRNLHWAGVHSQLSAMFNLAARAIAPSDAACAAVLQGAARRLATTAMPPPPAESASGTDTAPTGETAPAGTSFVIELRRETTGLVRERLGQARLAQLRAEGEAMDEDHAVAYAVEIISKALHESAAR